MASLSEAKDASEASAMARSLTFYRILTDLAGNLKGIMVPYFNNVLEHFVVVLQLPPPVTDPKSRAFTAFFERLAWILRALTNVLLYDAGPSAPAGTVRLMSTELYDRLLPVFVNLVARFNGESNKFYEDRVDNVVKPLVVPYILITFIKFFLSCYVVSNKCFIAPTGRDGEQRVPVEAAQLPDLHAHTLRGPRRALCGPQRRQRPL